MMKRYTVSIPVTGCYEIAVHAESPEEALLKANEKCGEADFGGLSEVDWECPDEDSIVDIAPAYHVGCQRITKERIAAGLEAGIIRIVDSTNKDGAVCAIGEHWFYFGGLTAEECSAEEYVRNVPKENIVKEIYDVLEDFYLPGLGFEDEYTYYSLFLSEHGI